MARGFESKDVEYQQAEAERGKAPRPAISADERDRLGRRQTIELALTRAKADLAVARNDAHRRMLESAIVALEEQLGGLPAS